MRFSRIVFAFLATVPMALQAQALAPAARDPRGAQFVTAEWLSQRLLDPNMVLLQVGDPRDYAAAHIPGARAVGTQDVSVSDRSATGLMLEMPSADSLRAKLAALGISDHSRIVVYYAGDWVTQATRVALTLAYAGLGDNSSILDGGLSAWTKHGGATTSAASPSTVGTLSPLKINNFVVTGAYVKSMIGTKGVSIIDGRAAGFYDGAQVGNDVSGPQRAGHIAAAKSLPFNLMTDDALHFRSAQELEAIFTKAGVGPHDVIIGYCQSGQLATAVLAAARSLGHPILLYDGSFQDWSRHVEFPVENPAAKKAP